MIKLKRGDGTMPDDAAFAEALAEALAEVGDPRDGTRTTVLVPLGTYRLTGAIQIPSGTILRGEDGVGGLSEQAGTKST